MSLYREAGRRSMRNLAISVVVTLVVGLGVGYAIGRSSAPSASGKAVVSKLRTQLRPVQGGLTLIPGEYAQAYAKEGVEAKGVQGALGRIDTQLAAARSDLNTLDPAGASTLERSVKALGDAIGRKAPPNDVKRLADQAATALRNVPGGASTN